MTETVSGLDHMEIIRRRAAAYSRPANVDSTVETRVIKEHDLFMLTDVAGSMPADNRQGLGLYLRDTRFLSTYDLLLAGRRPTVLHSSAEKNCLLSVDLTNPDLEIAGAIIRNQTVSINRSRLVDEAIFERITFTNYGHEAVDLPVTLTFGADFKDIFEVRGQKARPERGEQLQPSYSDRDMVLSYQGLDGEIRRTHVRFLETPDKLEDRSAHFLLHLEPREEASVQLLIAPVEGEAEPSSIRYEDARYALQTSYSQWLQTNTHVRTTSDMFDKMFERSVLDLRLLIIETEWGPVPTAGTPWYACIFGRDSLITALQSLIFCPELARATLRYLAQYQGKEVNVWREEEPGKIFHELRRGEMARLGEIPHTPYYGTVDATPLWLILLAETFKWTGDMSLVDELWDSAEAALRWIDEYGDMDGDGYVEYRCNEPLAGLINHGWKDSPVAVFNIDGSVAEQPIALVEIQAYVWAARRGMADLYELRGDDERARELREQAERLGESFNRDFWIPEREFFALALDGQKRQVQTITSNPGHALWTGIIDPDLARRMNARFKRADMLSGWGVRTVADSEVGYNPMGYQIGSVWPHDVSLLVAGLRRYGYDRDAVTIATQLYSAGREFLYLRFPELFTGIARSHNPFPVPWPVACSPQAWAAGTTLLLLQTFLGIYPDAGRKQVTLRPSLPPWLDEVRVSNLRIGEGVLDLRFMSHGEYSTVQVLSRVGDVDVMI